MVLRHTSAPTDYGDWHRFSQERIAHVPVVSTKPVVPASLGYGGQSGEAHALAAVPGGAQDADASRLMEICNALEEEKRRKLLDIQVKRQEQSSLHEDVQRLQKELERERSETAEATRQLRERIDREKREGASLEMRILKAEAGSPEQGDESQAVRNEVEVKTKEIVEAMQNLARQQQQTLQQVTSLASAMLRACSQPTGSVAASDAGSQAVLATNGVGSAHAAAIQATSSSLQPAPLPLPLSLQRLPAARSAGSMPREEEDVGDLPWFQAMKANLEEFGDVEVFLDNQPQECMSCCQPIEAAYRARPRKCSHVFHVECLLHCWSEGTCPVCGASFAPEAPQAPQKVRPHQRSQSPKPLTLGGEASAKPPPSDSGLQLAPAANPAPGRASPAL